MCEVVCPFKDKCTSFPAWCGTCRNNSGKRNYYAPEPYPIPYWIPWTPYYANGNYYVWKAQVTTQCP